MTTIALTSTKQSPGVTTTALALALARLTIRPTLLVEADPDGGDIAAKCGLSLQDRGLLSLAAAGRHQSVQIDALKHVQQWGTPGLPVVVASSAPDKTVSALDGIGTRISTSLPLATHDVIIDAGRLRNNTPASPLLRSADVVLVVIRPTLVEIDAVAGRFAVLSQLGTPVQLLLIGDRPYSAREIVAQLNIEVAGVISDDRRGVDSLLHNPTSNSYKRSLLARSCATVANSKLFHDHESKAAAS
jgi:MinD-like ATPase involved in chromosome partitioning or flagellar assembly